jgi:T5SS/PEP-CTERM-associated repeat protein
MNRISKQILPAAALTLTAGLTVFAQVTFNDRVGIVEVGGNAEKGDQKSMYLKQPPAASGGFALLEETGKADQGGLHAESTARLTQSLTFDPDNGRPRLVVEGTATALASSMGTVEGADRAGAHAQYFYSLDFSLSSPQFVQFSGVLDAAAHSGNVQVGFSNIVGIDPDGGFIHGDIGAGAVAVHGGSTQFQNIGFFETLPAGRYELLAFGSAAPGLGKFQFDHGFDELIGKANFSFTFDFASAPPQGNIIRWIEPAGGLFGQTQNWDPQQVPEKSTTRSDTALFDLPANYTVTVDSARTVDRLVVQKGRVDLGGSLLTVAALSPTEPSVSVENDARLNIAAGGLKSVHAIIGNAPPQDPANPPTAEVLVTNLAPGWDTTGNLAVGGRGRGRLFVANGGFVKSGSATIGGPFGGEAIVGGQDSFWNTGNLSVGRTGQGVPGQGTLTVENGGEVVSGSVFLGDLAPATGTIIVEGVSNFGVPSMLTANGNGITVGLDGLGTLRVENGGNVRSRQDLSVGNGASGSGNLVVRGFHPGSGSRSTVTVVPIGGIGNLTIGQSLESTAFTVGQMLIENGALVTSVAGFVGASAPASAVVRGSGNGKPSEWTMTGQLFVGQAATGTLNIESGGLVSARGITLADEPSAGGTITVTGVGTGGVPSTLKNTSDTILISSRGQSTLRVEGGGLVETPFLGVGRGTGVGSGNLTVKGFDTASGKRSTVLVTPQAGSPGELSIGFLGRGELLVENGAMVTSATGTVGNLDAGSATVRGSGNGKPSEWTMTGQLIVGGGVTGTLNIESGGLVSARGITLDLAGGTIAVTGVGMGGVPSTLKNTSGTFFVSSRGQSTLRVEGGGLVETPFLGVGRGTGGGSGNLTVKGFDTASGKRSTVR